MRSALWCPGRVPDAGSRGRTQHRAPPERPATPEELESAGLGLVRHRRATLDAPAAPLGQGEPFGDVRGLDVEAAAVAAEILGDAGDVPHQTSSRSVRAEATSPLS